MTKDEIIKQLLDMAKYPTVTMPRDCEALRAAAKLLAQPEPKPIAFVTGTHAGYFVVRPTDPAMVLPVNMALYTHPKEWQDLTDEEIEKMRHLIDWTADWSYGTFARAIEAKLKQKNGYAEEKNT